ncbi:MAG: phosphoribosylformylglycinamidine synthase [Clostridia bacterium]|nr:phosphoribosylformylglycinamidine synthase [Clostridia bacterium]
MSVKRVYVERKDGYDFEARERAEDFRSNLDEPVEKVRVLHRYDVEGLTDEEFEQAAAEILGDGATEDLYFEEIPDLGPNDHVFASEYKSGQFNQRTHSAAQVMAFMTRGERPEVRYAKVFVVEGGDVDKIKEHLINKEDAQEASLEKFKTLKTPVKAPKPVRTVEGFNDMDASQLEDYLRGRHLSMSLADAQYAQDYFRREGRNPTETELSVIDVYWSDHCRHTTFNTVLDKVDFGESALSQKAKSVYDEYLRERDEIDDDNSVTLMDLATMYAREARYTQKLKKLDISDDADTCSIIETIETDEGEHRYIIMFKNETRNSPTEADPLGGAATCVGGAIRDALVGRGYVYQTMRISGSGDPREKTQDTMPGRLPQRTLARQSARGASNYSKRIGVPTGLVDELYHDGYKAKHMEIASVIAAVPEENVVRRTPNPGDVIILLGGRTGRDGIGMASIASTNEDVPDDVHVQKGNPVTERKMQRLFRNPEFAKKVKRANDFGAGGVAVAVAELAPGVTVQLEEMPPKYPGLDGTELAISESQERLAVVVNPTDAAEVIRMAHEENLRANKIAEVTNDGRLRLYWDGREIVNLSQKFLDSNGAAQHVNVDVDLGTVEAPFSQPWSDTFEKTLLETVSDLNVASKKGMQDMFDGTIGAGTVSMPLGGARQLTPIQAMCALVPTPDESSKTATLMSYGCDPHLTDDHPFIGGVYALVDSVAKVVASGGSLDDCWFSLQEYFPQLGDNPKRWGQPLAALLGAYLVEKGLNIAAIGGKDSMNGSAGDIDVPATLCSFCVAPVPAAQVITPEFKKAGNKLYLLDIKRDDLHLPDFDDMTAKYNKLTRLIEEGVVVSAYAVGLGGLLAGAAKSAMGNGLGVKLFGDDLKKMTEKLYGAILIEAGDLHDADFELVGEIREDPNMEAMGESVPLEQVEKAYFGTLESVYPLYTPSQGTLTTPVNEKKFSGHCEFPTAIPRAVIPVFPGTTGEYDVYEACRKSGIVPRVVMMRNEDPLDLKNTIDNLASEIKYAQILILPGGAVAADEPDGAGKMVATAFRSGQIYDAVMDLIKYRDGLVLGISNGFQTLVRLGLVPYGEIVPATEESPTLTTNEVGRPVATMVHVRMTSVDSPWLQLYEPGETYPVYISHGEGRFMAPKQLAKQLARTGQIAAQYVNPEGEPTMDPRYNPNGSVLAVEALMSPDGRILGAMGFRERVGTYNTKNVPTSNDLRLFEGAAKYFR